MAAIHLRKDKERPLTIEEVDSNFDSINREVGLKLDADEFNAENILSVLENQAGAGSTLDADMVHGKYPSTEDTANTVCVRDEDGNIYAVQIYGLHVGNVIGNILGNGTGTWTGNSTNVDGTVQVDHGGTGAQNAPQARINLGLGSMAVQNKNTVDITGGTIAGIVDLAVADGGTGASTPINARSNLGLTIGSDVQAYAAILSGVSATSGDGFLARTSSNSSVTRSLIAGNSIEITNVTGKDGNPTIALTLNPTVSSLIKTGSNGAGDVGQSTNRFATIWSNYLNTTNTSTNSITKSGNSGQGDIGQSDNRFSVIYGNYLNVSNANLSSITKSGNNGQGDIGQSDNRFAMIYGTASSARYADLAERYTAPEDYTPGSVVVVSQDEKYDCSLSYKIGQRVLGVVSTNPAYIMNDECDGPAIALRGRVPVKVVGKIKKGDALICDQNGHGIAGDTSNSFAIALETNNDPSLKMVECVIL